MFFVYYLVGKCLNAQQNHQEEHNYDRLSLGCAELARADLFRSAARDLWIDNAYHVCVIICFPGLLQFN